MNARVLFDNKKIFLAYGILNTVLVFVLLTLVILLFQDIYLLSRIQFVIFVGIHLLLLFFVKINYLYVGFDEDRQLIYFRYNRRFGIRWYRNAKEVQLSLEQFDGYAYQKDSMGLWLITFYKKEHKQRFELGPFYIGILPKKSQQKFTEAFGESLD